MTTDGRTLDVPSIGKGLRLRAGYMGHVLAIGRHLLATASFRPDLAAALQANDEWQRWVAATHINLFPLHN